jgi:hypothetical protein
MTAAGTEEETEESPSPNETAGTEESPSPKETEEDKTAGRLSKDLVESISTTGS